MKNLLLFILLCILTSFNKKVECTFNMNLKMDKRLFEIKDSLNCLDTLILFRHWTITNGENGYARMFVKTSEGLLKKEINYSRKSRMLKEEEWKSLPSSDSTLYFLNNAIKHKKDTLNQASFTTSHVGLRTLHFYYKDSLVFCDKLNDILISFNKKSPRVKLLSAISDSMLFEGTIVNEVRNLEGPSYYLKDGKKVFHENPKKNRKFKRDYKRFMKK